MGFKEDYIFWHTINNLTKYHGFNMITMSEDQNEVWLEHNSKAYSVLRLIRLDFDWAIALKKDLNRTAMNGENIRKQLFRKPISILNVYFTVFKPVDEYESYINNPINVKKTTISSIIIESANMAEGLQLMGKKLEVDLDLTDQLPIEIEEEEIEGLKNSAIQSGVKKRQEEQKMFQQGKPIITKIFLTIQILVFILMEFVGSSESTITLVQFGAKFNPAILAGEWWRFITPVFVHIGILHLLMNSAALLYIGSEVEKLYGSLRFLFIYLFAGFMGVLASFSFSFSLSAGASGAVFGCFGALLYFGATHRQLFFRTMGMNIIVLVIINIIFGFTFTGVDNAAHLGGLFGGFIAAAAVGLPKKFKVFTGVIATLIIVTVSIGLLKYGYNIQSNTNQDPSIAQLVQEYISNDEIEEAEAILTTYLDNNIGADYSYLMLGSIKLDGDQYSEAEKLLETAVETNPDLHGGYYALANLYLKKGELQLAEENIAKALELSPNEDSYKEIETIIKKEKNRLKIY